MLPSIDTICSIKLITHLLYTIWYKRHMLIKFQPNIKCLKQEIQEKWIQLKMNKDNQCFEEFADRREAHYC